MKGKNIYIVLLAFLLVSAGCKNEIEYRIDENLSLEEYSPLDEMTMQMNGRDLGCLLCDEENSYFTFYEEGYARLYKKERKSGELTRLVERQLVEGVDVVYSNFYLQGEYLYFLLFDGSTYDTSNDLRNVLCRVKVDGSASFEVVLRPDLYVMSFFLLRGNVYIEQSQGNGFLMQKYNLEKDELTMMFSKDDGSTYFSTEFIYGDHVYYFGKNSDECCLYRCRFDGGQEELLFKNVLENERNAVMKAIIFGDKIYVCDVYDEKLYALNLDGSNKQLLLEGVSIVNMNMDKERLYIKLAGSRRYEAGLYEYRPGYKTLLPLYKGDDIVFGPIIDSYGIVWATFKTDGTRFGNLHKLDVQQQTWRVVK